MGEDLVLPGHVEPAELLVLRSLVLGPVTLLALLHRRPMQLLDCGRYYHSSRSYWDNNDWNQEENSVQLHQFAPVMLMPPGARPFNHSL